MNFLHALAIHIEFVCLKEDEEKEKKSLMTMLLLDENNNLTWPYSELDDKLDIL